ncbi:MAG: glycerol-3-phosphate 1-O-acyltransferase PlsY [Candidatus Omnitrophota bacterium]|jgi:glycerol-3-phosphate acyltransferase PlsY|nr:glycerol-3-phosphate 1-O-acyltransferase PlsY [Candidatus Omnitrophota bacterium]MDD5538101.1 glycerol-3-phosphate 1-O-acyltransferase PlsY [Candidatus Omnitrophota bacterium]
MLKPLTGLLISYLLGAIPTAYLFGRLFKGIDLRQHGSGNLGATNAFRVLGKGAGTLVLIIDILKGTAAVLLSRYVFFDSQANISLPFYLCLAAVCAVAGHNWTVFLGFKGGKGVATSLGVLIAFSILIEKFSILVLLATGSWLAIFLATGFVSLASVICSAALPILGLVLRIPVSVEIFLAILGVFSIIRHKTNIYRLLQKKESRFNTASLFKKVFK